MLARAVFLSCCLALAGAAPIRADSSLKDQVLSDCLILPSVSAGGRTLVHRDPVEAEIVAGGWKGPRAGDKVTLPGAAGSRSWIAATAKDGALDHLALRGGYLYWKVETEAAGVMMLEASGHTLVYVNGEPRPGDPYQNGIVHLPVALKAGANDLLFLCGRGHLNARLKAPRSPALLEVRDATLPDLAAGEAEQPWAAVVVVNAEAKPLRQLTLVAGAVGAEPVKSVLPTIPPLTILKVGFRVPAAPDKAGEKLPVELKLFRGDDAKALDEARIELRIRESEQSRKRTFLSSLDGSVQYYAVQPGRPDPKEKEKPALYLTLHGASVEAIGQADAYAGKSWGPIVAPTNRRPYGFDWEDWGRLDAMEVLELAQKQYQTDPRRVYLTGHSMGGHGVWHLGATYPDRWAAIAPSAGWISFWTYAGGRRPDDPQAMQAFLLRPSAASETLALARNYAQHGVYVLHGEADDNVPVEQARQMRQVLGGFHPDFVYYERPGAGHWWGNECVDWPPLFEFLNRHTLPLLSEVRQVRFVTVSPGVSASCRWATIETQRRAFQPSSIDLSCDPAARRIRGSTDNVTRLTLDLAPLKAGEPFEVVLDGQKLEKLPWPEKGRLWLKRDGDKWEANAEPSKSLKGPHRYGPFKEAFRNRMIFVYGTKGTAEENAAVYAKARCDAETFWYRGNGSVDVVADVDFDAAKERDRNVILYGDADGNAAWKALLADSPVQVRRGEAAIGERKVKGDDLACLFVRPRPGSDAALVGVVAGTGPAGMRLTDRLPYFSSGVGVPDCLLLGSDMLTKGTDGVRAAGFFGEDWGVASGEFLWKE